MFKLMIAIALVASASAYQQCPTCVAAAGSEANFCAYEGTSNCGCNSCNTDGGVNAFRFGCGLNACGDRRLTETTDLEEQTQETASWGRRRRRFFDARRRRRRFFDYRRRRRRTSYPTPFPTPSPTGILGHKTCKSTTCTYTLVNRKATTDIYSMGTEKFHCEKVGRACRCVCGPSGRATRCALRHHHETGYKRTFTHC